jgi:PKD repeat protein
MSHKKYVLLGVTGLAALMMVGANASQGTLKIPSLTINTPVSNQAAVVTSNPKGSFPDITLSRSARGEEIIAALGDKLPEVARYYKLSEEELKKIAKDKTLHADKKGRLFFSDEEVIASGDIASLNTGNLYSGGYLPLEETFLLHSKPGSTKVLYLDFDGHYFAANSSVWIGSEFNAPGFDIDGNPGNFNDAERQIIQEVWLTMAEDFISYDVDVTTQAPTGDKIPRYGNRVLFTQSGGTLRPGAGGSSYIGVFDDSSDYYKVALVFPEMLAYSSTYMADAGTHEAGHSLGLYHDGVTGGTEYYYGHNGWAPIMGVSYYVPIAHWSKGEYSGANNTQDDLQVMQTYGLSYRPDDYGNSISQSVGNAAVSGNTLSAEGLIERTGDIDFIKFNTGAGDIVINVRGAYRSSNLDAKLSLYNSSGQMIASSDPYGLEASINVSVPGGTYYISVTGVGTGDPTTGYSNYGSLGQYYISGTIVGTNNNPPVVVATANPMSGSAPLTVQFNGSASYDPDGSGLSYAWDFGDNTSSTQPDPVKTYENGGTYTAMLTVTDSTNLSSSRSVQISAVNQAPIASFTTSYSSANIPMTVYFDASASSDPDGFITTYTWDFGDGSSATGVTASHVYTTEGTYVVKLTAIDNGGIVSTKSVSITAVDPNVIVAPTNLSASATGRTKNQVTLKWTDRSSNETIFFIERAVKATVPTYQVIGQVGANITTYTESVPSNTYYYRVRAYDGKMDKYSTYSNAAQARVK